MKASGQGAKAAGRGAKAAGRGAKAAAGSPGDSVEVPEHEPTVEEVALVAPTRSGRVVSNIEDALKNSEIRLKLAWIHRALLDPALPQQPPFHALAWTALRKLRRQEHTDTVLEEKTKALLGRLLTELVRVRKIVTMTSPRGDAARERVGLGKTLRTSRALIDEGEKILREAHALKGKFPALTAALLAQADDALAKARAAVERSKQREVSASVERAAQADDRQLALDVLLDAVDHLRAAALATLPDTRPQLAALLASPLEPRSQGEADEDEGEEDAGEEDVDPAPTPPKPA